MMPEAFIGRGLNHPLTMYRHVGEQRAIQGARGTAFRVIGVVF
jgi:hypothetical protein